MEGYYCTDTIIYRMHNFTYETHGWRYHVHFYHIETCVYLDPILMELWS